ncbi:hypothetical protein [Natronorubrum sp. DTA7]|uniref:hypothetical protein n=1 Tax=Natronorubrum sp. DTA7 TaxID=3447016 RepID=UPI003F837005
MVYVRNAPSGHEEFYDGFPDRFTDAESKIDAAIEGTNFSITGNKSNVLRREYEIEVDRHDDFFDAYLAALARAISEGVVSNPELIETIDRLYEATITEDVSL